MAAVIKRWLPVLIWQIIFIPILYFIWIGSFCLEFSNERVSVKFIDTFCSLYMSHKTKMMKTFCSLSVISSSWYSRNFWSLQSNFWIRQHYVNFLLGILLRQLFFQRHWNAIWSMKIDFWWNKTARWEH